MGSAYNKEAKELEAAVEGSKFSALAHHVLEGEVQEEEPSGVKQYKTRKV